MLNERGAKIGAEIGTDHGQYAEQLCIGIPNLHLICVDPWAAYSEGLDVKSQEDLDKIYEEAHQRLKSYNVEMIRETSMNSLPYIADGSLDFVFIDGNHSYSNVLEDITEWSKKVKLGGVVCGHDYKEDSINNYGVIEAVNKYVKENNISPLFILHSGGKLVDCWLFFKQ